MVMCKSDHPWPPMAERKADQAGVQFNRFEVQFAPFWFESQIETKA